jgi:hypothetical protein
MGTFTTPEWIIQITPIISMISDLLVTFVALLGIGGIRQWRRQLKFGDQYKTAHRIVGLSLRFRREFGLTRLPSTISSLTQKGMVKNELGIHRQEILDDIHERQNHLTELFGIVQKLYEESLEVEGFLGTKESGLTIPLETEYRRLNEAFQEYINFIRSLQSETLTDDDLERFRGYHDILFSTEDDYFTKRVNSAIENIRDRLKKYIK